MPPHLRPFSLSSRKKTDNNAPYNKKCKRSCVYRKKNVLLQADCELSSIAGITQHGHQTVT